MSVWATVVFSNAHHFLQLAGHAGIDGGEVVAPVRVREIHTWRFGTPSGPYLILKRSSADDTARWKCTRHEGRGAVVKQQNGEVVATLLFHAATEEVMAWLCGRADRRPLQVLCQTATPEQPEHTGSNPAAHKYVQLELEAFPDMSGDYMDTMHNGKFGCLRHVSRVATVPGLFAVDPTPYEPDENAGEDAVAWTARLQLDTGGGVVARFHKVTHTAAGDRAMHVAYKFGPNMKAFEWSGPMGKMPNLWLAKNVFYATDHATQS